jgi:hypothetical protein
LFEQADGILPDVEGGYYVYRIPADGVLKVRTSAPTGIVNLKYFYLTKENRRKEIKYLRITGDRDPQGHPQNKYGNISDEEVQNTIFVMDVGGLGSFNTKSETIQFTSFVVGKPIDSEKLSINMDNRIADLHRSYVEKDGN